MKTLVFVAACLTLPVCAWCADISQDQKNLQEAVALLGRADAQQAKFNIPLPQFMETPQSKQYTSAALLINHNGDMAVLLRELCKLCIVNPRFAQNPRAETGNMIIGFMSYAEQSQESFVFQNRHDWTLHFTYGAAIDARFGLGLARLAASTKESMDAGADGNYCDYGDYAATVLGAEWAEISKSSPLEWISLWADGRKSLSNVPAITFGHEPHGAGPNGAVLQTINTWAHGSLAG